MNSRLKRLGIFLLAAVAGCAQTSAPGGPPRILFIGNSLTYVNDVPGIVQAFADSAGVTGVEVETVGLADFALVDHWNEGSALKAIRRGGWTHVVLQQGPSSVEANRDTLRLFARKFADEIRKVGGKTALFSAWPTIDRRQDFPRAIESYTLAASDVGGVLLPVAAGWLAAWRADSTLQLYSDGLHANQAGSYLAAMVIYARIFGASPAAIPAGVRTRSGVTRSVLPSVIPVLRGAAAEAAN